MDRLLSYEAWKGIQAQQRAEGRKLSNCYLLPAELRKKIEAGVLYLERTENALFLLEDAGSFYRCYYWFSPSEPPGQLRLDKEAVVEFPFTGKLNDVQWLQVEQLEGLGFTLGRESGQMSCDPAQVIARPCCAPGVVRAARIAELPEILALLCENFDPRFAFLPTPEELAEAVAQEAVLVVSLEDRVAAALVSGFEKKISTIRQVTTDAALRGKGIGSRLIEAYHRRYAGQAVAFRHWVDLHNASALAMYRSFGYEFSLRKANEYIFSPTY